MSNPLHSLHEQAEAAFLPYGPNVQIVESFGEVELEYAAIRKSVALMDAPHRTVVILTGKDRLGFLHNKITNNTKDLAVGKGCYAYLLNLKGRIVMDMNILHGEEATLVELDSRLAPGFIEMMDKYIFTEEVRILDGSSQLARLTLIGPLVGTLLEKVLSTGVSALATTFDHARLTLGQWTVTVFRHDLCGETQFEMIVPRDALVDIWHILHEAGGTADVDGEQDRTLRAIGWSAFNTARIEAGTPLYGIDITDNYLPMETGHWYPRAVSVTKGCYLGQEIVARMHAHNAVARLLVGMRIETGRSQDDELVPTTPDSPPAAIPTAKLPVAGTDLLDEKAAQIGIVTSSCMSPMLGFEPIALGYLKKAFTPVGKAVDALANGGRVPAQVVALPFWKKA